MTSRSVHDEHRDRGETGIAEKWRTEVWQGLSDAARLTRYFEHLHRSYLRAHQITRVVLAASAAGLTAAVLDLLPVGWSTYVGPLLGAVTVGLVVWDLVVQLPEKTAVLHSVSVDCLRIEDAYRSLWLDCDDPEVKLDDIRRRHAALQEREIEAAARLGDAGIATNERVNQKCWEDVVQMEPNRYATSSP